MMCYPIVQMSATTIGRPQMTAADVGSAAYRAAKKTTSTLLAGARRMNTFVAENHWSLKMMSIIGFMLVLGFSIAAVAGYLDLTGQHYWMNVFVMFFSLANLLSESGETWPVLGKVREFMFDQFGFLRHNLGRGFWNIFFGLIFASLWPFPHLLVGIYVIFVGLLYMAAHWRGPPPAQDGVLPAQGVNHVQLQEETVAPTFTKGSVKK